MNATRMLLVTALLVALPHPAFAVDIFFNGVKVTGLRNQRFPNCSVRFDKSGNVRIVAKGYTVQRMTKSETKPSRKSAGAAKALTSSRNLKYKYFLVSSGKGRAASNWDVDVFFNGRWVQKVRGDGEQVVAEVTRYLKPGRNTVMFTAVKNYRGGKRLATSPKIFLRVLLGRGSVGGGTVSIDQTIADFRARADQVESFSRSAAIVVE